MTNYIWITTQFEGFHKYPEAPEEVKFLRDLHRHIFHVKVWIEVFHNEREIEFISFKRHISNFADKISEDESCETMADNLADLLKAELPERKIKISISEDGENGCEKEY